MKRLFAMAALALGACSSVGATSGVTGIGVPEYVAPDTRLVVLPGTCSSALLAYDPSTESLPITIGVSLAKTALSELFALADRYVEQREEQLTAKYGSSIIFDTGISGENCAALINGVFNIGDQYNPDDFSRQLEVVAPMLTAEKVEEVFSIFLFDLNSVSIEGHDLSIWSVNPWYIALLESTAQRAPSGRKSLVVTLDYETFAANATGGVRTDARQEAFQFSSVGIGDVSDVAKLMRHSASNIVSSSNLDRPQRFSVNVVETEEVGVADRIVADLYKAQSSSVQDAIVNVLGLADN